jgi:hypothetical protein
MDPSDFDENTTRHHEFDSLFEKDLSPIVIRPYLAQCRICGRPFPYHPVLWPGCPEPDCASHRP